MLRIRRLTARGFPALLTARGFAALLTALA
jgi:hypothetical protein